MPARAAHSRLVSSLAMLIGSGAAAQDLQNLQPAAGTRAYFEVESARTTPDATITPSVWLSYGHEPVVRRDTEARISKAVVGHQTTLHLQGALGLGERLELTLGLPLSYVAGEGLADLDQEGVGLGDVHLGGKLRLFGLEDPADIKNDEPPPSPFGMAFVLPITLPLGDEDKLLGAAGFSFTPTVVAEFSRGPVGFAAQIGGRLRTETDRIENIEIGHELTWGVAAQVEPGTHDVLLIAEVGGSAPLGEVFDEDVARPVESLLGVRLDTAFGGLFTLGGGLGINPDQGVPTFRVLAGFTWRRPPYRGPAIDAGALLGDTDQDGVLDIDDRCAGEAEDEDGYQDDDGCPEVDNDGDGIRDSLDRCPDQPEVVNGFQDGDGCPDRGDQDGDGLPDDRDECPEEPEDRDGYRDRDGCADLDNDADRVPDQSDRCPDQPETVNGFADADGCPDELPPEEADEPDPKKGKRRR